MARNINAYLSLAAFTILFYDYCLTVDQEVLAYWGAARTWARSLFYVNRYVSIGASLPVVVEYFWTTENPKKTAICYALQIYHQYFAIVAQIFVAAMLIMRTYALYDRSRRILVVCLAVAASAAIIGAYIIFSGKKKPDDLHNIIIRVGCPSGLDAEQGRRIGYAWTGMLAFDLVIFGFTLAKALAVSRQQRGGLLALLARDGSLYFLVIVASNSGNIISCMYAGPYTRGVVTTFTNIISSVMISRLMLNLRLHKLDGTVHTADSTTLHDMPITTVADPYYTQNTNDFVRSDWASGENEGVMYSNDISLVDLRDTRPRSPLGRAI
ncbi:hypothetical protein B0H16DRAFT_1510147 [Mycena metata]|uniref:DUF6533 domain-containing protein n=1 Tax=Mycena metata TaxID=1033252 RepID=A0AAD7JX95_9AGAR|nr:hypothetical protein B0H16DRAFT_1510147 [Mycena metata]